MQIFWEAPLTHQKKSRIRLHQLNFVGCVVFKFLKFMTHLRGKLFSVPNGFLISFFNALGKLIYFLFVYFSHSPQHIKQCSSKWRYETCWNFLFRRDLFWINERCSSSHAPSCGGVEKNFRGILLLLKLSFLHNFLFEILLSRLLEELFRRYSNSKRAPPPASVVEHEHDMREISASERGKSVKNKSISERRKLSLPSSTIRHSCINI